ncbi:unnamed protein product [Bemisia tabaci]|uniref:Ragulator complex protein LAMTOR1 n=1 Tax=Bemisia tabaci TaxID=7038 RepID=A0A9P0A631_BEMTA|nr:unnamed protein product [Bemisia tabaci]
MENLCKYLSCCFSCGEDSSSQAIDSNERTHLLVDPVINNTSIQRVHSDDYLPCDSSLPKKTDEQSALNRILQETATNVIDVAALGSHNLEQHEYLERTNYYTAKLSTLAKWSFLKNPPSLLVDIPVPEKVLSASPISSLDLDLMNIAVEKAVNALLDLKLEPGEDLVVPFRIP